MATELELYKGELEPTVLGVDLDDVLYPTAQRILDYHRQVRGVDVPPEHFYSTDLRIWGAKSVAEALAISEEYIREGDFFDTKPYQDAIGGIAILKNEGFILHAISGRPVWAQDKTEDALEKDFPGAFEAVHCTAHLSAHKTTKATVCERVKAAGLIDDFWGHAPGVRGLFVLYGQRPWHRFAPHDLARAVSWEGVRGHFHSPNKVRAGHEV